MEQLNSSQWTNFQVQNYLNKSPMSRTQDITKAMNQAIQQYLQWCLNNNHLNDPTKDEPSHPYLYQCWRHSWTQYQKISEQHLFQ